MVLTLILRFSSKLSFSMGVRGPVLHYKIKWRKSSHDIWRMSRERRRKRDGGKRPCLNVSPGPSVTQYIFATLKTQAISETAASVAKPAICATLRNVLAIGILC